MKSIVDSCVFDDLPETTEAQSTTSSLNPSDYGKPRETI